MRYDDSWYAGTVVSVPVGRRATAYSVEFDDGDSAKDVKLAEMRVLGEAPTTSKAADASAQAPTVGTSARGLARLATAKKHGHWEDGVPLGRGHGQPYLQPRYADLIRRRVKTVEGRANVGWAAIVASGDWVTFKIPGTNGKKLVVRVEHRAVR